MMFFKDSPAIYGAVKLGRYVRKQGNRGRYSRSQARTTYYKNERQPSVIWLTIKGVVKTVARIAFIYLLEATIVALVAKLQSLDYWKPSK